MSQEVKDFDFGTADLEAFLDNVIGMNIIFRNKMRSALKGEVNEMTRIREIFDDITLREETQDVSLMTPAFRTGFITLFNMNVRNEDRIQR